jgi:hypothetical protein
MADMVLNFFKKELCRKAIGDDDEDSLISHRFRLFPLFQPLTFLNFLKILKSFRKCGRLF